MPSCVDIVETKSMFWQNSFELLPRARPDDTNDYGGKIWVLVESQICRETDDVGEQSHPAWAEGENGHAQTHEEGLQGGGSGEER